MQTIYIVTGNANKLKELQLLASDKLKLDNKALELTEIQSLDLKEIVTDKVKRAYDLIKQPVIVEDVSAEMDSLEGLPGPFIKFFMEKMGSDALLKLTRTKDEKVTIRCTAAYYDGQKLIIAEGQVRGTIVEPRGPEGFGFDPIIVPDGQDQTMSEMGPENKLKISHRGQAFRSLFQQIEDL